MPSPKKVLDIIPPKDFGARIRAVAPKPKKQPERRSITIPILKLSIVFFVVLLLAGVLTLHFVFQRAVITIWPETEEISITQRIVVATETKEINTEENQIPGVTLFIEKEATQLFDATGLEANATKSQGSIRVFNERSVVQILIIHTRFISEDGFIFLATKRIAIPAQIGSTPGFLDVAVVAAESGSDYNIGASNFSVPGLAGSALYTMIYGKSERAMVGGSIGNTTVVTQTDIDKAEESLIATVTARAKRDIRGQLPEGFVVADEGFFVDVLESSSVVKPGSALAQFNYSVTLLVKAIAFKTSDLKQLSRSFLATVVEDGKSLNIKTFQMRYKVKYLNMDEGQLGMDVTSLADSYVLIDTGGFAELVAGTTPLTAEVLLRGEDGVERAQIDLRPFWLTKLPVDLDKIEITVYVD